MGEKIRILIAEDSLTQSEHLRYVLESHGYEVDAAKNGKEAIEHLASHIPSVIISDVMMPEMDGFTLCKIIKSDEKLKRIPVILLTMLSEPEDVIHGLESGADNFMTKPFYEAILIKRIRYVLLNMEMQRTISPDKAIEITLAGKKHIITSSRVQILNFMLSMYENALHQNNELVNMQNDLINLNERLEELVRERTAELSAANNQLNLELEERRRVEASLSESEKRYRQLLDSVTNYIYTVKIENRRPVSTIHGAACYTVTGYTAEEYRADPSLWWRMIYRDDRGIVEQQIKKVLAGEETQGIEHRIIHKNGSIGWVKNTIVPKLDRQGNLVEYSGLVEDITERKNAEEQLKQLKNQYEMILHSVSEGIIGEDFDGRISFANDAACKLLGYRKDEIIGQYGYGTVHHLKGEEYAAIRASLDNKPYTSTDETLWRKDGTSFPAEYTVTPIKEDHSCIGMVIVFRDITQMKKLKEAEISRQAAETANQAKSDFLANMSHELRTPLNAVIGFAEVLEDRFYGELNEKQHEYVKDIHSSGKHLLSLINDILDLSKVEAGKLKLEITRFLLRDVLNASMIMLKEKAMKHGIDIGLEIATEADIEIEADERKLKQIMFNLLSNAMKFTPGGGSVYVQARLISDFELQILDLKKEEQEKESASQILQSAIEISVKDTGIGIRPEDMDKLFKEFSQVESAYTRMREGTGLGLALTKKLVDLHGGMIWAESEFGKGSRFWFVIPVKQ